MPVTEASRKAYYKRVFDGTARNNRERIMRFLLSRYTPYTRHEIAFKFRPIYSNPPTAFDGMKPIYLPSVCSAVHSLKASGYLKRSHKGKDPITGADDVEFVSPIGDKWEQRRMFNV